MFFPKIMGMVKHSRGVLYLWILLHFSSEIFCVGSCFNPPYFTPELSLAILPPFLSYLWAYAKRLNFEYWNNFELWRLVLSEIRRSKLWNKLNNNYFCRLETSDWKTTKNSAGLSAWTTATSWKSWSSGYVFFGISR